MSTKFKSIENSILSIKSGKETISNNMNNFLDTIEKKNRTLNAIITRVEETTIRDSVERFEKLLAEKKKLPPLAGFPIAIKDLQETQDILTTFGSSIFRENIGRADSPMVRNLKNAGCIVVGKSNVPEFGVGGQTYNPLFGATLNPFDTKLTAGGSSGGAAAAVAAGMLPFADGSDMMGSIRTPSSFCSLFGFRPTPNLIPPAIGSKDLPALSSLGGIARSTKCLSYLLDAQVGNFLNGKPKNQLFSTMINVPLQSEMRLAWLGDFNGAYTYEAGIKELCEKYLETLKSPKVIIDVVNPTFPAEKIWESWTALRCKSIQFDLQNHYLTSNQKKLLKPEIIWEIEQGFNLTNERLESAIFFREEWEAYLRSLFEVYDFLLLPSAQVFPFSAKQPYPTSINGIKMDTYHRWMEVVIPASLAGLPTMSMPCGYSSKGLPLGVQLIGSVKSDVKVLKGSHWLEKIRSSTTEQ